MRHGWSMATTASTGVRRTVLGLVGIAAIVLLAGCLKLDTALTVKSDDTVSGSITLGVNKSLLALSGQSGSDLLQGFPEPAEGETQVEPYEDETYSGVVLNFQDVPLEDWNAQEGDETSDVTIVRDGDLYRFTASFDTQQFSGADASAFGGTPEVQVRVTFPGEVIDANGTINGTTVSWEGDQAIDADTLTAVARAGDGGSSGLPLTLLLLGGGAVLAAGLVAFLVVRQRKGKPQTVSEVDQATPVAGPLSAYPASVEPEGASGQPAAPDSVPPPPVPDELAGLADLDPGEDGDAPPPRPPT